MRYTRLYNGIIEIYDEFLPVAEFNKFAEDVKNYPFYYGERDNPNQEPTGLMSNLKDDSELHLYFMDRLNNLKIVDGLVHERSMLNFFAPNEKPNFHNDWTAKTILFYFNTEWNIDDGGETKFLFQQDFIDGIEYNEAGNMPIILGVPPIPNRLVIFNGEVMHTASAFKTKARISLAMKFQEPKNANRNK